MTTVSKSLPKRGTIYVGEPAASVRRIDVAKAGRKKAHRKKPLSQRMNPRKANILRYLHQHKYATSDHIFKAFWSDCKSKRRCEAVMKEMYDDGLLRRITQPSTPDEGKKPYVYHLDKLGAIYIANTLGIDARLVQHRGRPDEHLNPQFPHTFECTDFRISFEKGSKEVVGLEIKEWYTDKQLKVRGDLTDKVEYTLPDGKKKKITIIPDHVIRGLYDTHAVLFLYEHDRSTETLEPLSDEKRAHWRRKIQSYLAYFKSKEFVQRYGDAVCRVLVTCNNASHLQSLIKVTARTVVSDGGVVSQNTDKSMFWFANFSDVCDPKKVFSAPIWTYISGFQEKIVRGAMGGPDVTKYDPIIAPGKRLLDD